MLLGPKKALGLEDPTRDELERNAAKGFFRGRDAQDHAAPIHWDDVAAFAALDLADARQFLSGRSTTSRARIGCAPRRETALPGPRYAAVGLQRSGAVPPKSFHYCSDTEHCSCRVFLQAPSFLNILQGQDYSTLPVVKQFDRKARHLHVPLGGRSCHQRGSSKRWNDALESRWHLFC